MPLFQRTRRTPAIVTDPTMLTAPQAMYNVQDPFDDSDEDDEDNLSYGVGYTGEEDDWSVLRGAAKRIHNGWHTDSRLAASQAEGVRGVVIGNVGAAGDNMGMSRKARREINRAIDDARVTRKERRQFNRDVEDLQTAQAELANAYPGLLPDLPIPGEEPSPDSEAWLAYHAYLDAQRAYVDLAQSGAPKEELRAIYRDLKQQGRQLDRAMSSGALDYGGGDTIITNPAFLTSPQSDFKSNLGSPYSVSYGVGALRYGDTTITNPAFLTSPQGDFGENLASPYSVSYGVGDAVGLFGSKKRKAKREAELEAAREEGRAEGRAGCRKRNGIAAPSAGLVVIGRVR